MCIHSLSHAPNKSMSNYGPKIILRTTGTPKLNKMETNELHATLLNDDNIQTTHQGHADIPSLSK